MANRYLGLWKLIPTMCKYDVGEPPLKATYHFAPVPNQPSQINVGINWTDKQQKDFNVNYLINLNGQKQTENLGGKKVDVLHELTQEGRLRSTTLTEEGVTLMDSYRELKENDKVLEVIMETHTPMGVQRIFQRYEKA